MPNYTRKAVRGAGIVFIMLVAAYFLGYIFRLLIARELGVASYGSVYAIIALFGLFSIPMSLGLEAALVKYIAQFRAENKPEKIKGAIIIVLFSKLLLSVLICGALILFSDLIASEYFDLPELSIFIKVYAVGIILSAIIATVKASLQGFQSMRYFSSTELVKSVIVLVITVPLLLLGFREMAPMLGFAFAFAILPLIYLPLLIQKVFPEFLTIRAELSKPLAKKLFKFGIPVILTGLAGVVFGYTDTLILTYFRSMEEVGLYNAAFPTMSIITVLGSSITSVLFPLTSELWAKNRKLQLSKGLGMLYKYILILIFPIALMMFLFPEIILGILFGGEFRQAGIVLRILAVGYFVNTFSGVNHSVFSGIGKPKMASKILLSGAALHLILSLVLIPAYGMEGAAVSTTISFILIFILSMKLRGYVPFVLPWRDFIVIVLSGFLITAITYLIKSVEWLGVWHKLILTVLVGVLLYSVLLLKTRILTPEGIKGIMGQVR